MFLLAGCVAIGTGGVVALAVRGQVPSAPEAEPPS
jgi:hypothetical protein